MRPPILTLVTVGALVWLASGCAKPEEKFGRGLRNMTEFARMGEIQRSVEQTSLFEGGEKGYTTGLIRGVNRSLVRTGVGIYEVVTAPFPPYGPVWTNYIPDRVVYPDSYKPLLPAIEPLASDAYIGFSGGELFPMVPGSRFRVFDN